MTISAPGLGCSSVAGARYGDVEIEKVSNDVVFVG